MFLWNITNQKWNYEIKTKKCRYRVGVRKNGNAITESRNTIDTELFKPVMDKLKELEKWMI